MPSLRRELSEKLKEGDRVLVYTVALDGAPATIRTINNAGNLLVMFDEVQKDDDTYDDEPSKEYSGQLVHPIQVVRK